MNICNMSKSQDLAAWVKSGQEIGSIAHWHDKTLDVHYFYIYKGANKDPHWTRINEQWLLDYYIKEVDKFKVEEPKMNKRCDNCKYFNSIEMSKVIDNWCSHEKHSGVRVAAHTSCPEHEPKEELTTPLDGVKFYLVNACTGEIGIRYICEDCGKEMKKPFHWWMTVPYGKAVPKNPGLHYRCEECDKKKEGKI